MSFPKRLNLFITTFICSSRSKLMYGYIIGTFIYRLLHVLAAFSMAKYLQITVKLPLNKPGNRIEGVEVQLHPHISALHGSQRSASRPGRFAPEKSHTLTIQQEAGTAGTHRARGWVHPTIGSESKQIPFPSRQLNAISGTLDPQPGLYTIALNPFPKI
jgi:hypothetical protein